jgi:hypothetical protein
VYIRLAEGPELSFITRFSGGVLELIIQPVFNGQLERLTAFLV